MSLRVIQTSGSMAEYRGGPPRTIAALSTALSRRPGVSVDLLTGVLPDDGLRVLPDPATVKAWFVPGKRRGGVNMYDFTAGLAAVLDQGRDNVIVHDNGLWTPANIAVANAVQRHRLPYLISPHGMLQPRAIAYHRGRKRIAWQIYQRRIISRSAGLLATAEIELQAIRARFPKLPVAIIANGVAVPPQPPARDPDLKPKRALFMSRLHPTKNLPTLIDAWARICADPAFDDWVLDIAGPDEVGHRAQVEARVERAGIASRVRFLGPIAEAEKSAVYATADLFVQPSFTENFSIVVSEALAHGVPVIATHGAPWSELPVQGCGWWVAADTNGITEALRQAMALDPQERTAMGARGRAWVLRTLDWGRIAEDTAAFYEWTLHGGHRPDFVDA